MGKGYRILAGAKKRNARPREEPSSGTYNARKKAENRILLYENPEIRGSLKDFPKNRSPPLGPAAGLDQQFFV
jgi:hypothetical protein